MELFVSHIPISEVILLTVSQGMKNRWLPVTMLGAPGSSMVSIVHHPAPAVPWLISTYLKVDILVTSQA